MAVQKHFTLVQLDPEIHEEDEGTTRFQRTLLREGDKEDSMIARVDTYVNLSEAYDPYYAVYWSSTLSGVELAELTERCVVEFEKLYSEGVPDLRGGLTDPLGLGQPTGKYDPGVILFVRSNNRNEQMELSYQRPLQWGQVQQAVGDLQISLVRFVTPIGDFIVDWYGTATIVGVISHVKEISPFVNLMIGSSQPEVSAEQAAILFKTALASIPAKA